MSALDLNPYRAALAPYLFWVKLALFVLMAVALFAAGWYVNGTRWEAKKSKELTAAVEARDKALKNYEAAVQSSARQAMLDAAKLSELESQKDTLLATLSGLKLTRTITVKPDVQGNCNAAVFDDAFRVRWNAVAGQAAGSPAAADSSR
jgi:hypothetical protein